MERVTFFPPIFAPEEKKKPGRRKKRVLM